MQTSEKEVVEWLSLMAEGAGSTPLDSKLALESLEMIANLAEKVKQLRLQVAYFKEERKARYDTTAPNS